MTGNKNPVHGCKLCSPSTGNFQYTKMEKPALKTVLLLQIILWLVYNKTDNYVFFKASWIKSKSPTIVFSKFKSYKTFSIVTFKKPEYTVQQQKRKLFSAKESY